MTLVELDLRERKARAQRLKLFVQMLTTFAYGALGLALADPIVRPEALGPGHVVALCFGLASAFVALYLAPEGERYA